MWPPRCHGSHVVIKPYLLHVLHNLEFTGLLFGQLEEMHVAIAEWGGGRRMERGGGGEELDRKQADITSP